MAHRAAPLATRSTGGLISAGAGAAFAASQMTRPLKPQWDVRPPQGGIPAWAQPSSIRTRDAPLTDDQPGRTGLAAEARERADLVRQKHEALGVITEPQVPAPARVPTTQSRSCSILPTAHWRE